MRPLILAAFLSLFAGNAFATEYYLDPTNGLDTNPGTSPAMAWKSNAPVNATQWHSGDKLHVTGILNCSASAYTTTCFTFIGPNSYGLTQNSDGGLVTIDNYGAPYTINVQSALTCGICAINAPIAISGGVINGGGAAQLGDNAVGVYLNSAQGLLSGAIVTGMEIHDFTSGIWATNGGGSATNGTFTNNYIHGSTPTTTMDNGILMQGWSHSLIQGNRIENIGGHNPGPYPGGSGNGILISNGSSYILDQFNITRNGGANVPGCGNGYGNWGYDSAFITIRYNEVSGQKRASGCDGGGFDLDNGVQDSVVEFNYSHDNAGPGYNLNMEAVNGRAWGRNTIRNNISVGDGLAGDAPLVIIKADGQDLAFTVSHNVFWNTVPAGFAVNVFQCTNSGAIQDNLFISGQNQFGQAMMVYMNHQTCPGLKWTSNAWHALSGTPTWYEIENNIYTVLSDWQLAIPGGDVGAVMADPANLMGGVCYLGTYGVCPDAGTN